MSYDIYFVRRPADGRWDDVLFDLEGEAGSDRSLQQDELEVWESIVTGVCSLLPDIESFEGDNNRELTDEASGIQLFMYSGELSLSVPYWYSGPEAEALVAVLRQVVEIVEGKSGLVAFDPQAEGPFLETDASAAASSFDKVHQSFTERGFSTGQGALPTSTPATGWRRLFNGKS